jgi:hypothetical protein
MSSSNENDSQTPTDSVPAVVVPPQQQQRTRRVGRVERWLRKGFGFIIDIGGVAASADNSSYGWIKDNITDSKVFVYHNALVSQSEQIFHRLYAHELVEYTIDTTRDTRDGRYQAFNVTGIRGGLLLCDLNANNNEEDEPASAPRHQSNNNNNRRHQTQNRNRQPRPHAPVQQSFVPPGATVVYYMPQPAVQAPPQAAEPSYVMPISGIPVPK